MSTAFLCGKTGEKVHLVACPEFGEDAGKILIVEGSCYGLKTSAARFHERISSELCVMGFRPSEADFDLWMRPKDDHYEYVATHVDDIMVFSKDCMSIINQIRETFDLKGVGTPEYYLGGDFHTMSEPRNTLEAGNDDPEHHLLVHWIKEELTLRVQLKHTWITQSNALKMHVVHRHNSPMHDALCLELDDSPLLGPADHSKFRSLIGCATGASLWEDLTLPMQ